MAHLRAALMREVPGVIVDTPEGEQRWITEARTVVAASAQTIDRPQLLVVVNRSPSVQQMRIVLTRPDGPWASLGGTKMSTGKMGRRDYYLTPTAIFLHTDLILDWRAEGTFKRSAYSRARAQGNSGVGFWLATRHKGLGLE